MRKHLVPAPFKRGAAARSRHTATLVALSFGLLAGPALLAAGPTGLPPPGQYRIDAETTTTSRAGPTTLESVQRIDGPTGRVTLTQKSSVDAASVTTQTANGTWPNRWCVFKGRAVPPAKLAPGACQNALRFATPVGSNLGADCNVGRVDEQWRRIDERTWERSSTIRQSAIEPGSASNNTPKAALELAMHGMKPGERVRAQGELTAMPGAADMADAHDTSVALLEQQVNSGSAKKAAVARQHLKVLRDVSGGSTDPVVRIKERWSRTAYTCSAGS